MIPIEKMEKLYLSLNRLVEMDISRLVESNSGFINSIIDDVNKLKERIAIRESFDIKEINKTIDRQGLETSELRKRIISNTRMLSDIEINLAKQNKELVDSMNKRIKDSEDKINHQIFSSDTKIDRIKEDLAIYKKDMSERQVAQNNDINNKLNNLERVAIKEHKKEVQEEIGEFREIFIRKLNEVIFSIHAIEKDIAGLKRAQELVVDINKSAYDEILNKVNERLNNFIDVVNEKIKIQNGNPKEVLKRIAALEGLKDSIEHRKSSKEVIDYLNAIKLRALQKEARGLSFTEEKTKIDILTWILGDNKNG